MAEKLRLEVLLNAVDKISAPFKRMGMGARSLAGDVGAAEQSLKKLQSQQRALDGFKRSAEQLRATRTQLQAARLGYAELAAQTHTTEAAQKAHAAQMAAADATVKRLAASFDKQTTSMRRARAVMESRGITNPAAAEAQLATQVDKTTQALQKKNAAYQRMMALEKAHGRITMHGAMVAAGGMGAIATGRRTVQTGLAPVNTFMQHEDAMLGIARQVQGARDKDGNLTQVYRDAEAQVRELSTRLPQTTVQIAEMMTAAARMEVPTDQLGMFVELSSEMATAFDAVPDQLAESMGKIANNLKMPITEIRGMADAINYLDDNAISKGADIIGFMNRVSGVTGTVGISGKNMAALGSTLLTSGETEETAGTSIKAIFTNFAAATKGTKRFKGAVNEIGMTPAQLQAGMAKDAVGTLMHVAEAINKLPQKDQLGVMAELAGKEHVGRLAKLVTNTEELRRQIQLANSEEAGGSMSREAGARNSTLSAQLMMEQNRLFNAMSVAGETLKAPLLEIFKIVNPLLARFTAWMQANPALVGGVLKAVVALGLLSVGLGALLVPVGLFMVKGMLLRMLLGRLMFAFSGAGTALRIMGTAALSMGRALLFTPVGAIIAGIALAALLIYKYWEPLSAFFSGLWRGFSDALAPAFTAIGTALTPLRPVLDWLVEVLGSAWNWFTQLLAPMKATEKGLQDISNMGQFLGQVLGTLVNGLMFLPQMFFGLGGMLMDGLANGITSKLTAVRDSVSMVAGDAVDWFKDKMGIHSPSRVFMQLGNYVGAGAALGIQNSAAMVRTAALGMAAATMVPMPAMATPMPTMAATMAGSAASGGAAGSTYQITINPAPGMDAQTIARAVAAELDRRESEKRSRRYSNLTDID